MATAFDKVSITAKLAAYMRQFSDIPFADDVAAFVRADDAFRQVLETYDLELRDFAFYAPIFELRYKGVASALRRSGLEQVLELASGLSLRGLDLAQDPRIRYVETDLPELTGEKASLVEAIARKRGLAIPAGLHIEAANALNLADLEAAVASLDPARPLAILTEGLLMYLNREEITTVARNVRHLLQRFGGIWITSDFSFRQAPDTVSDRQLRVRAAMSAFTERPMYQGAFENEDDLRAFLVALGFSYEVRSVAEDMPELVSMKRLDLPASLLDRMRERLNLWTLRLAGA